MLVPAFLSTCSSSLCSCVCGGWLGGWGGLAYTAVTGKYHHTFFLTVSTTTIQKLNCVSYACLMRSTFFIIHPFHKTETRISICILIRFHLHDHILESEFRTQLRYFTLLEFETLSRWCLLNCSNSYSFFLAASKQTMEDLSETKKIIIVGSCVHSIHLFAMEVNSEDYRRCVHSFAGGIPHQQAAVGEAKIFFFLSGHRTRLEWCRV